MGPWMLAATSATQARRERINAQNAASHAEDQALLNSNSDAPATLATIDYLERKNTSRKHHKVLKWGGGIAVVAAGAVLISSFVPSCEGALKSLVPNVSTTTQQDVNTALLKVSLKQDAIIVTGEGTAGVDIRTSKTFNLGPIHVGVPLSNEETGAQIEADLNIISKAGAVAVQGVEEPNGKFETLATVNETMIEAQRVDNKDTLTGGQQFIPNIGDSFGVPSDLAQREGSALALAQTNFEGSCAPVLSSAEVMANAEAAYIHSEIEVVAEDTKFSPTTHDVLTELASQPVLVQFVDTTANSPKAYSSDFVIPSEVKIALPTTTKSGSYNSGTYNIDVSGESCLQTESASDELEAIKNGTGFQVLPQPMDLPKPPNNAQINKALRVS